MQKLRYLLSYPQRKIKDIHTHTLCTVYGWRMLFSLRGVQSMNIHPCFCSSLNRIFHINRNFIVWKIRCEWIQKRTDHTSSIELKCIYTKPLRHIFQSQDGLQQELVSQDYPKAALLFPLFCSMSGVSQMLSVGRLTIAALCEVVTLLNLISMKKTTWHKMTIVTSPHLWWGKSGKKTGLFLLTHKESNTMDT